MKKDSRQAQVLRKDIIIDFASYMALIFLYSSCNFKLTSNTFASQFFLLLPHMLTFLADFLLGQATILKYISGWIVISILLIISMLGMLNKFGGILSHGWSIILFVVISITLFILEVIIGDDEIYKK